MEGRQEGVEPLDHAMICRLWAVKWRQSHGVIAQCNSARCGSFSASRFV
jgi:hypothetical protein